MATPLGVRPNLTLTCPPATGGDRTGSPVSWYGVTGDGYGSSTTGENPAVQRRPFHNQTSPLPPFDERYSTRVINQNHPLHKLPLWVD